MIVQLRNNDVLGDVDHLLAHLVHVQVDGKRLDLRHQISEGKKVTTNLICNIQSYQMRVNICRMMSAYSYT